MNKILTVLIPTFNSNYLLKKVLNAYQNDPRVNIVISDDSNNSLEKDFIKSLCLKYNLRYLEGPRNNPVNNWNFLLTKIDTPFFVINHHDDLPNNLKFLDHLEENVGLTIMPCSSKIEGRENIHVMKSWQQFVFSKVCLLIPNASFNMILAPTAAMIVNSKFKNVLFDENLVWFVDAKWFLQLFKIVINNKFKIKFFSQSRVISCQSKTSITNNLRDKLPKQILKEKNYLLNEKLYPGNFLNAIQYILLFLILLKTKVNQFKFDFF